MKEYEKSGLSVKKFCHKNNINFSRFRNWRYKIQQKQKTAKIKHTQPNFIPLVINEQNSAIKTTAQEHNFELRVATDGIHISIPSKFNTEALSNILSIVERIKC